MKRRLVGLLIGIFTTGYAYGGDIVVHMHLTTTEGVGKEIGTVTLSDSPYGLILTPHLNNQTPGEHSFHVHQNPHCGPGMEGDQIVAGLAAGGHYDPEETGKHEGPYGYGHRGDLPVLCVAHNGQAVTPMLAPRLKAGDLQGHSLVIHVGGDNYSDQPQKLGGGGARVACGVVE